MCPRNPPPTPSWSSIDGDRWLRIAGYDALPPFFMTVASATDVWLFLSSSGGLTAGRRNPDHALFPYYTDDKITESAGRAGGVTLVRAASADGQEYLWQPLGEREPGRRTLYKSALGDAVMFEHHHHELELTFRVTWSTSPRFGLVRRCSLESTADRERQVELLDGVLNLLPSGATQQVQNELSSLLDAYKRAELDPDTGLGLMAMSSQLTDLAEPAEALTANVVWGAGLPAPVRALSAEQVARFRRGEQVQAERDVRGRRGAYLVESTLRLTPGRPARWCLVADVDYDSAQVIDLREALRDPSRLLEELDADAARGRESLVAILGSGDGFQVTGDERASVHHLANVLFNSMRGGVPLDGYSVPADDFRDFVRSRSAAVSAAHAEDLDALPESVGIEELRAWAEGIEDPDLDRLALEYLPLTFSRRHGDPSRPWNRFDIRLVDEHGRPRLGYEGNWRDIFQNWEALARSFPEYVEGMIAVFVNATTADGYNPYRVTRQRVDWEVPEPENPWSNIGYWSDHQIIYLLKLLETSARFHPGRITSLLGRPIFTHADVPYRIKGFEATLADPHNTIEFDHDHHQRVTERASVEGGDGRLVHRHGELVRVTLAEKLLLLLAAKVVNLVPGGGIWMNTQRPEWNDANNALVGHGLSVVTLAYLRRYLKQLSSLLVVPARVDSALAGLIGELGTVLRAHVGGLANLDEATRLEVVSGLGQAGERFRDHVHGADPSEVQEVSVDEIHDFLDVVLVYVEDGLRASRRPDGLFHSYNTLALTGQGAAINRLPVMLEGQVAVLSSGILRAPEVVEVLTALRESDLYRADQHSYLLYPDRALPGFMEKNVIPADAAEEISLFRQLVAAGDRSLVVRDRLGALHFAAGLRNARSVAANLEWLAADPEFAAAAAAERDRILAVYEEVFSHRDFTGRSGSFFAYEGLGSIYWHMVSKLLLAVQEATLDAVGSGESAVVVGALAERYEDIRRGLGYCKSARRVRGVSHRPLLAHSRGQRCAATGHDRPGQGGDPDQAGGTRAGCQGRPDPGSARVAAGPGAARRPGAVPLPRRVRPGGRDRASGPVAGIHVLPGTGRGAARRRRPDRGRPGQRLGDHRHGRPVARIPERRGLPADRTDPAAEGDCRFGLTPGPGAPAQQGWDHPGGSRRAAPPVSARVVASCCRGRRVPPAARGGLRARSPAAPPRWRPGRLGPAATAAGGPSSGPAVACAGAPS